MRDGESEASSICDKINTSHQTEAHLKKKKEKNVLMLEGVCKIEMIFISAYNGTGHLLYSYWISSHDLMYDNYTMNCIVFSPQGKSRCIQEQYGTCWPDGAARPGMSKI